jgi:hypothetical protein
MKTLALFGVAMLTLVVALMVAGQIPRRAPTDNHTLLVQIDSLRGALACQTMRADTAMFYRRSQARLIKLAELATLENARIVARNPGQSVFLRTWTRRVFADVIADSGQVRSCP